MLNFIRYWFGVHDVLYSILSVIIKCNNSGTRLSQNTVICQWQRLRANIKAEENT